jgi:hypothetical protein
VNPATTATSLISSANPARVTYTATVTSQYSGAVTGTVTFQDAGSTIATVPLASNQAAYSTTYTKAGYQAITATYSGDASNLGSTSATLMEYIDSVASKTVVTTSGSPSLVGQPVTFTAAVTSTHGAIPDGELVTFYDGTTAIGTGTTAGGVATFTTSSLTAKTHTIKATYAGDDMFEPSTKSVKQVVDKYTTTTTLSSSLNPSNYGQAVTFRATVTSTGPNTPTGKVEFKNGTKSMGTARLSGGVDQELMGHKTIQMTVRYAHLAPQHSLAAVQRLCDTETVQKAASDTTTDTGLKGALAAESVSASQAIELSVVA